MSCNQTTKAMQTERRKEIVLISWEEDTANNTRIVQSPSEMMRAALGSMFPREKKSAFCISSLTKGFVRFIF